MNETMTLVSDHGPDPTPDAAHTTPRCALDLRPLDDHGRCSRHGLRTGDQIVLGAPRGAAGQRGQGGRRWNFKLGEARDEAIAEHAAANHDGDEVAALRAVIDAGLAALARRRR